MGVWAKIIIGDSRNMAEVADGSVSLVVTSPPYWHIKDYGVPGQIGYGQTFFGAWPSTNGGGNYWRLGASHFLQFSGIPCLKRHTTPTG